MNRASFLDQLNYVSYKSAKLAVESRTEFIYRRICRDFSRLFHTPLKEVEEYPLGYVLQHVFEHRFDEQHPDDIRIYLAEIVKKPEEIETEEQNIQRLIEKFEKDEAERIKNKREKAEEKQPVPPEINLEFDDDGNL